MRDDDVRHKYNIPKYSIISSCFSLFQFRKTGLKLMQMLILSENITDPEHNNKWYEGQAMVIFTNISEFSHVCEYVRVHEVNLCTAITFEEQKCGSPFKLLLESA